MAEAHSTTAATSSISTGWPPGSELAPTAVRALLGTHRASLDGIALKAGVSNATLYRTFPTRDDLLAAVMQTSIEEAVAESGELARTASPREALAEWLARLTWQLRIWHDLHSSSRCPGVSTASATTSRPHASETGSPPQASAPRPCLTMSLSR
ncbi:TetR/AcrR family transcriptional regulator [Amycolatopsis sp. NPDC006131]|uniref:TetR/AcrR family transcriptional regulator n=1 Tax=Amycolatopsis sp. NPDC006131 TaxID=3156731 RepID=UPI0033BE2109